MLVKRKMWVLVFGKYDFKQVIYEVCPKFNVEVLKAFKPDMMVDIHLGVKGKREDIERLKEHLIANKNTVATRCPRRSFQFEI